MEMRTTSTAQRIFEAMLDRIRDGRWPVGAGIPSERSLIEDMGVSRIVLREALSMLRALGLLETVQGRGSIVRPIDSRLLGRLLPLMIGLEGEHTYEQVYEVRLLLEPRHAYLAALRRSDRDLQELSELHGVLVAQVDAPLPEWVRADMAFHQCVSRVTKNPLLPLMLQALADYVIHTQKVSCAGDRAKRDKTVAAHANILESIRLRDAERARVEMEAHLRASFQLSEAAGSTEALAEEPEF